MILTNKFNPDPRVYKEAKYLIEKGFDVEILCWDRENEYVEREQEIMDGIKIKRFFPYSKYGTGIKQLKSFIHFVNQCKEYLKEEDFQYLHCHDLDGIIAGYFVRKNHVKFIFDMHEIYEVNGKKQNLRYLIRWIVNYFQCKSDYIIYVNKMQTDIMLKKNKYKAVYLPNYPEIKYYKGVEKTKSDKIRISYIGSVRQFEQLKSLMEACKDLDNVLISIHGSGVHTQRLKQIEHKYNNVRVTGGFNFKDSAKLFSECDILYAVYPMTSLQSKFAVPAKFYEAIVTKTPMIINKGKNIEHFVKEKNIGFVVDGNNVKDIRNLIIDIVENKKILNEKMLNLCKIQYKYSWEEISRNLDIIYQ